MRRPASFAILLAIPAIFLLSSGNIFGATPKGSIYSQLSSGQTNFVSTPLREPREGER
jgi:hypothetical protein